MNREEVTQDDLPLLSASGLGFLSDPHLAAEPPGVRGPGYKGQIMAKLRDGLAKARERDLVPVLLGDLFHRARGNPRELVAEAGDVLAPHRPWVLVGNNDLHNGILEDGGPLRTLERSNTIRLMDRPGPYFLLRTPEGTALFGATPYGYPYPDSFDAARYGVGAVLWGSHHHAAFPEYPDKPHRLREIPGVDWVVNGHLHRPLDQRVHGSTFWLNIGSLARGKPRERNKHRVPVLTIWTFAGHQTRRMETVPLAHQPFSVVFPCEAGAA